MTLCTGHGLSPKHSWVFPFSARVSQASQVSVAVALASLPSVAEWILDEAEACRQWDNSHHRAAWFHAAAEDRRWGRLSDDNRFLCCCHAAVAVAVAHQREEQHLDMHPQSLLRLPALR